MAVNKQTTYHEEQNKQNIIKMRAVLDTLPRFCKDYFRGIENYTSARTRLAYAYDLRVFFEFLHTNNPICAKTEITEYKVDILEQITRSDILEYLDYMSYYEKDGMEITNDERGKSRKLAALRSFYNFYFTNEMIPDKDALCRYCVCQKTKKEETPGTTATCQACW